MPQLPTIYRPHSVFQLPFAIDTLCPQFFLMLSFFREVSYYTSHISSKTLNLAVCKNSKVLFICLNFHLLKLENKSQVSPSIYTDSSNDSFHFKRMQCIMGVIWSVVVRDCLVTIKINWVLKKQWWILSTLVSSHINTALYAFSAPFFVSRSLLSVSLVCTLDYWCSIFTSMLSFLFGFTFYAVLSNPLN